MGLKHQTTSQALASRRMAATVAATKPVKVGGSFVLDFSDRPKRRFIEQSRIISNQRQAVVCILLTVAFLLLYYYGFELSLRNGCTLAQRVSSKSSTRIKNCGLNSTSSAIILECCANVTQMGPLYLSQIVCILVGMHSGLQHKSKPSTPLGAALSSTTLAYGGILWHKYHTTTIFL